MMFVGLDLFHGRQFTDQLLKEIIEGRLFRDHKSKLKIAFVRLPGFDYQQSQSFVHSLNEFKNRSLYSDILHDGEMYWPGDFFHKERASQMLSVLENSLRKEAEELGLRKLKQLKNVSVDDYIKHYKNNETIFHSDPLVQLVPATANYIDLLAKLVRDEKTFNAFKQGASSSVSS